MNLTRNAHTHSSQTCIAYITHVYVYGFYLVKFKFNISLQQVWGEASRVAARRDFWARFFVAVSFISILYLYFIDEFRIREDFKSNCVSVKELVNQQKQQT